RSVEVERLGDHPVQSVYLGFVTVEELEEAGLSAGCPLDPEELQLADPPLDFNQIENQLIAPERCALTHGHQLRGLEMRVAQAGAIFGRLGERSEGVDRGGQLVAHQFQS